ncbi:YHYH protein (plasmid) [Deinococcus sp. KNUC1210]|uniref:YHYH protein n=1 Tax=Deinococcus sp. KNUC1210 TaxID=2917691 RepID=UPI001EEFFEB6|nr:YHYH protein [Deinococcus sp. KNUC1210]ULH17784.1 YHYH protein [Deinococcus sp. KNUC1210]
MKRLTLMLTGVLLALTGCRSVITSAPTTGGSTGGTTTATTAGVLCDFKQSVYNGSASVKATSTAAWTCNSTSRMLSANGLPDHTVGTFPNVNNPNTISAQNVSATMTLTPVATSKATSLGGPAGTIGYALNGVKFDPGTGGNCNDSGSSCTQLGSAGQWRMEALGQTSFNFGVDDNNAHVQPGGVYHYHGMPEGLLTKLSGGKQAMTLVGWAADGFPVYARYGYSAAGDATSAIKVLKGSYKLKTTPDANRPATSLYPMGTFMQDYQYVAASGDLDECNGRTGVTPEFPGGTYYYAVTDTYPYIQRCVKGSVTANAAPMGLPPRN